MVACKQITYVKLNYSYNIDIKCPTKVNMPPNQIKPNLSKIDPVF